MSKFKHGDWVIRKSDGLTGKVTCGQCLSMNGVDYSDQFMFYRDGWFDLIPKGSDGMTCIWGYAPFEDDEVELFELKIGDGIKYKRQFYNPETKETRTFERTGWISQIRQDHFPGGVSSKFSYNTTTFIFQFGDPINFGPLFKDCCLLEMSEIEIYECSKKVTDV